jgi:hypothetical protein
LASFANSLEDLLAIVPMKKPCATITGKNFVDRSAASAFAVNRQILRNSVLSSSETGTLGGLPSVVLELFVLSLIKLASVVLARIDQPRPLLNGQERLRVYQISILAL